MIEVLGVTSMSGVSMRGAAGLKALLVGLAVVCGPAAVHGGTLEQLPQAELKIGTERFPVRVAASPAQRAQGFQDVPAADMDDTAIYFRYTRPQRPRFHMHDVAAPLMIAWIGPDGRVLAVDGMEPGRAGYAPPSPIRAALEYVPEHPLAEAVSPGVLIELGDRANAP